MADKNYRLDFEMTDGSTKSVEFTSPQGEKGDKGDTGYSPSISLSRVANGVEIRAINEDGVQTEMVYDGEDGTSANTTESEIFVIKFTTGLAGDKTQAEVREAVDKNKVCIAVDSFGVVYSYAGEQTDVRDFTVTAPTFVRMSKYGSLKLDYGIAQVRANGIVQSYQYDSIEVPNPYKLVLTGAVSATYDGSQYVSVNIPEGGGSGLPEPEGPHMQLVTDSDGNWTQEERLAYSTTEMVDYLPETTPTFSEDVGMFLGIEPFTIMPEAGKTYTVVFNGVEYECVAEKPEGFIGVALGNTSAVEGTLTTNDPFAIVAVSPENSEDSMGASFFAIPLDGSTSVTVKIVGIEETVKPIDDKYIRKVITISYDGELSLDNDSFVSDTPFDTAWKMDEGKLQSAIRVVKTVSEESEDSKTHAVSSVRKIDNVSMGYKTIEMDVVRSSFAVGNLSHTYTLAWIATADGVSRIVARNVFGMIGETIETPRLDDIVMYNNGWRPVHTANAKEILGIDPYIVTITQTDSGYVANQYARGIYSMHQTGRRVYADMEGTIYNLAYASIDNCVFSAFGVDQQSGPFVAQFTVKTDTVEFFTARLSFTI